MSNLKEMRLDILLFLTILFFSILVGKAIYSFWSYMSEDTPGQERDERYAQGAFLDDTTTDIETFLKHKQHEDGSGASPNASKEPKHKLNFAMISSFMKR